MSAERRRRPPESYVHGDGAVVVVPARVASWLLDHARLRELRIRARGVDGDIDAVLTALTVAGLHWQQQASEGGSNPAPKPETEAECVGTEKAGAVLGISSRAVRAAILEGRLEAERIDGRWRISRQALQQFRERRKTT